MMMWNREDLHVDGERHDEDGNHDVGDGQRHDEVVGSGSALGR